MKNYPHLYNSILAKKAQIKTSKTPKKTIMPSSKFPSTPSSKALSIYNRTLNRDKRGFERILTRSIEEQVRSESESEEFPEPRGGLCIEDEELFSRSYSKIGRIKQQFPYKNIDQQLNEVLTLIRDEKLRINVRLKALKQSNDYYRSICQNYYSKRIECGVNTDDKIQTKSFQDKSVGSQSSEIKIEPDTDRTEPSNGNENIACREAYMKLASMLEQMNINPQDILPCEQRLREEILINDYKALTEKETITIQKFFIKKLIEKISK